MVRSASQPKNDSTSAGNAENNGVDSTRRRRVPIVDEITALLRERIYAQHYATGVWLKQEQLSDELGVSRTPLREALRRLEQEGLVRSEAGKGARVISGDVHTLLSAYELRAVVDGLAARLASANPSPARVREMRQLIDAQRKAVDPWNPRGYSKLNVDFHELIVHMTNNEFVIAQTSIIRMTAQVFAPVAMIEPSSALRAIEEHATIADAIEAGDGVTAEIVARRHIEKTITQLRFGAARTDSIR
ncbi:GntR family transcriptional regulator [Rhodococcus sp. ACPA1]|uniref:GntR family transcriptional regulator n=1 Tax=Rhodococcus sp. ACPA1 TaxID=2028572 RepID=UPI000A9D633B|nr:GntR family transcriptional regulator [Rhodococcus sp. ACPA1]